MSGGNGKTSSTSSWQDDLPAHVRLTMRLNEIAFEHGEGLFWHMPLSSTEEQEDTASSSANTTTRQQKSNVSIPQQRRPLVPDIVFTIGKWSSLHKQNFKAASKKTKCHGTDFSAFAPPAATKLWAVKYLDSNSNRNRNKTLPPITIDKQTDWMIIFTIADVSGDQTTYCATTSELETLKPKPTPTSDSANDISSTVTLIAEKARLHPTAMDKYRVTDDEALYQRMIESVSGSGVLLPPAFDSQSLLSLIPGAADAQRVFRVDRPLDSNSNSRRDHGGGKLTSCCPTM